MQPEAAALEQVLILDTETTGLDPSKDRVIEIGAILYSIKHATAVRSFSSLVHADENPAQAVNRIPVEALRCAPHADVVWREVWALAEQASAIVAHQAEFDRTFSLPALRDLRPWVCSMADLRWPKQTRPAPSLVALALDHDLGVACAHRALTDCELIARLFTRAAELGTDLAALLARGLRPKADFVALVSYDDREKAKAAGFQWEPVTKQWRRRMAIEDAAALPFQTRRVA